MCSSFFVFQLLAFYAILTVKIEFQGGRPRQRRRTTNNDTTPKVPSPYSSINDSAGNTELQDTIIIMRTANEVSSWGILDRMNTQHQFLERNRARVDEIHSERIALHAERMAFFLRQEANLSKKILQMLQRYRNEQDNSSVRFGWSTSQYCCVKCILLREYGPQW